jgi:hypothetical protein
VHGVPVQHEIVEVVAAEQQAGHADAGIDQHAARDHRLDHGVRDEAARRGKAEDQCVEDDCHGDDDAGLESAPRAKLAVEVHVERKEQHERNEELRDDAENEVAPHGFSFRCCPRLRSLSNAITPAPAVKTTVVSPSVSYPR